MKVCDQRKPYSGADGQSPDGRKENVAREFMDRARYLAECGRYSAAPNPLVGAVIVRGNSVVGEGWHARTGRDHAELAALKDSGDRARGATMYVTMEPCNHYGRTPPCTAAILEAGITRVVVGVLDPNPKMRGKSVEFLRDAGVEVEVPNNPELERQNEQFFTRMISGRPFVHLKLAMTLDGRIAASSGDSNWVTGGAARQRVHYLRAEAGAVLVGAGTARADDPLLTVRDLPDAPPPVTRVVLDPRLSLSPDSRLARSARELPVVVFAGEGVPDQRVAALTEKGVEVVGTPEHGRDLDLGFVLDELGRHGVRGLLVEGGGKTAARFLDKELADKLTLFYAPKVLGSEGVPAVGPLGRASMFEASRYSVEAVERFGDDVALTLYPALRRLEERKVEEEYVHGTG